MENELSIILRKIKIAFSLCKISIQITCNDWRDVILDLYVNIPMFQAEQTLYLHTICILIAPTIRGYSLQQMLLRVQADGTTY